MRVKSQMVVLFAHEGVITSRAIQEVANSVVAQYRSKTSSIYLSSRHPQLPKDVRIICLRCIVSEIHDFSLGSSYYFSYFSKRQYGSSFTHSCMIDLRSCTAAANIAWSTLCAPHSRHNQTVDS